MNATRTAATSLTKTFLQVEVLTSRHCTLELQLRLEASSFTPSDLIVKSYENTKREVLGVATLDTVVAPNQRGAILCAPETRIPPQNFGGNPAKGFAWKTWQGQ
ncbi:hypothetical protein SDJN03_29909, partial [Cucurbita argyrosperma subsp. sororia]